MRFFHNRPSYSAPLLLRMAPWILLLLVGVIGAGRSELVPARRARPVAVLSAAPQPTPLNSPILPIPAHVELDPRRVALGRRLFHDRGLSRDGTIACVSCHDPRTGGDDGRRVSIGVDGLRGTVNAPTVLNSGFNFRQFWDGRALTLEEQVDGPIQNPNEMDMTWGEVVARLGGDADYRRAFEGAYGEPPRPASIRDALATFERSLITPGSAFDRYLLGERDALPEQARAGYELFLSLGCVACHQGVNVGGNMFQPLGKMEAYFERDGREPTEADLGRFHLTHRESDRYTFKVPSLRNVERTAPYFHDGSVATLEEAVQLMARFQLGEELGPREVAELAAFLCSLTGTLPSGE